MNASDDAINITTTAQLDRIAAVMATHTPHRLPLIRAARNRLIALAEYQRSSSAEIGRLKRMGKPVAAIIGDDDLQPTGPKGWTAAPALIRWASSVLLHAAGGEPAHYEVAVMMALASRRLLIIETDSTQVERWLAVVPRSKKTLLIQPPDTAPHPRPRTRMELH